MDKSISILGAGWLGEPLGIRLLEQGWKVRASTRSLEKAAHLEKLGIEAYQVDLTVAAPPRELMQSQHLYLTVPPSALVPGARRRADVDPTPFIQAIQKTLETARQHKIEQIWYTSSTSVYGNAIGHVHEASPVSPHRESGKMILQAEQMIQEWGRKWTILRLGGLVGAQRSPARSIAGKSEIADGEAPVNLVHRQDVIALTTLLLERNHTNEVFNVVAPEHPSRQKYYTQRAAQLGLPLPTFQPGGKGKKVSSQKITDLLQTQFQYPNPLNFPL